MILEAISIPAAAGLIALWVVFDAIWFFEIPKKKDKKFKDRKISRILAYVFIRSSRGYKSECTEVVGSNPTQSVSFTTREL
jgi:hypothetical protein